MTDFLVYPGLGKEDAKEIYSKLSQYSSDLLSAREELSSTDHYKSRWRSTGHRVEPEELEHVRKELRELGDQCGWPEPPSEDQKRMWSRQLPSVLHTSTSMSPADASKGHIWSWLSLVLVPDLAIWRWPTIHENRVTGYGPRSANRNFLRVAWWRAEILGAKSDDPPALLFEDRLVSLFERPGLTKDHRTAKMIVSVWLNRDGEKIEPDAEEFFQQISMRLIRKGRVIAYNILSEKELQQLVEKEFEEILMNWPPIE